MASQPNHLQVENTIPHRTKPADLASHLAASPIPGKPATLVQVARLAGVGIGTASRVLNNEGYVSERTATRVRAIIEQLDYKPNEVARNLKVRRSGAIGIVVAGLADPFIAACVQAAQIVIRNSGSLSILAFTEGSAASEAQEIDYLVRRQVDGILIIPAGGDARHLGSAALHNKPIVAFNQPIPGESTDSIVVCEREGAMAATEHLLTHHHRRIAALGVDQHLPGTQQRAEGYCNAMDQAGLSSEVCLLEPGLIAGQVDHWLASPAPPTAIFALDGTTSMLLAGALAARDIRIPDQIAVIGFDDFPLAALLSPPLTVVRQPAAELGAQAATMLLGRMGNLSAPARHITLETELILRQSCGCSAPATS